MLFPRGTVLGTQSLRVCQSPGGGRDEFPGLLAGCLPPSLCPSPPIPNVLILLPPSTLPSFLLLCLSSSLAGDVGHCRGVGAVVGGRMEGQTLICAPPLTFPWGQRRGKEGLGGEGGCCINQKQSRDSCLWPGNTSVILDTGKGDVNIKEYIYICMYLRMSIMSSQNSFHRHHLILWFLFLDIKEVQEGLGGAQISICCFEKQLSLCGGIWLFPSARYVPSAE